MSPTHSPLRTRSHSRAPALRLLHGQRSPHTEPLRGPEAPAPALRVVDRPTASCSPARTPADVRRCSTS